MISQGSHPLMNSFSNTASNVSTPSLYTQALACNPFHQVLSSQHNHYFGNAKSSSVIPSVTSSISNKAKGKAVKESVLPFDQVASSSHMFAGAAIISSYYSLSSISS